MNKQHKHNHCYPELIPWGVESNGLAFTKQSDVKSFCYCTMSELCSALITMPDEQWRESIVKCIHKMTDDKKGRPF